MAIVNTATTDKDLSQLKIIFTLVVSGLECLTGMVANGFIAAVQGVEWARGKRLAISDHILLRLSLSRLLLQSWVMLEDMFSLAFRSSYNQTTVYTLFKVVTMFLNYCNLWLAAWLNVFYCLRIATFSHPLFLMMKRQIVGLMPQLVWLSLSLSACLSLPFFNGTFSAYVNSSVHVPTSNSTEKKYFSETNLRILALLYYLGISLPLSMFILAATLLIASLRRHTLHMRSQATGSRDPSMQAHVGAIKALSYFLILYTLNAAALFLSTANIFDASNFWTIVCKVITAAYPSGHSVLLIVSNPGLRRAWKRLQHLGITT